MPHQKTSEAEYFTARFNPKTSEEDRAVLEVIRDLEGKGWNFKQIVQDAILKCGGYTPEMFSRPDTERGFLEEMLGKFAQHIIDSIPKGGIQTNTAVEDDEEEGNVSPFARNLARSFAERNKRGGVDE